MGSKLFWSSLFGIVIIVLLGATLYVRSIAPSINPAASPTATGAAATPTPTPSTQLIISFPADDTYTTSKITRVSGRTRAGASIAITGGKEDVIVEADQAGTFATEIMLVEGINQLTITAVHEDGTEIEASRTVVYEAKENQ